MMEQTTITDPITERKNEQLTADGIRCGEHVYAYFSVVFFFDDAKGLAVVGYPLRSGGVLR